MGGGVVPHRGISVLMEGFEKSRRMGAAPPMPPSSTMVNPGGASQNLMGGGLKSKHEGSMGELKMLLKNTYEGVHLIVKLPAISLQASKLTKNELLHTYFPRILARF